MFNSINLDEITGSHGDDYEDGWLSSGMMCRSSRKVL
jgi:hypothetical protein